MHDGDVSGRQVDAGVDRCDGPIVPLGYFSQIDIGHHRTRQLQGPVHAADVVGNDHRA